MTRSVIRFTEHTHLVMGLIRAARIMVVAKFTLPGKYVAGFEALALAHTAAPCTRCGLCVR